MVESSYLGSMDKLDQDDIELYDRRQIRDTVKATNF